MYPFDYKSTKHQRDCPSLHIYIDITFGTCLYINFTNSLV